MSKRSRALYEADLQAQQSPFVAFGTPLPPSDPSVRDDGSFVPVWKQEVRDAQGRRRLHGAFTGGWSAGYYNTVGSKEGWTPSSFVSSRTNRRKENPDAVQFRPEDYMDEEDLADAEESRKIQTSHAFAGLGLTADDASRPSASSSSALAGLFSVTGETKGKTLLKKMGWKEGQGIGPKVRRIARLDVGRPSDHRTTFLFAPEDVVVMRLVKKTDHKGLGFQGEGRLASTASRGENGNSDDGNSDSNAEDNGITRGLFSRSKLLTGKSKVKSARTGGIGIGVLNDTGSDDEDPYDMGPRISFNRVIGSDKKKKKKAAVKASSTSRDDDDDGDHGVVTRPKLVFSSLKSSGSRVCHDGRPPLKGFVLGKKADALTSEVNASAKYPPPVIPPDWKSSKRPRGGGDGGAGHQTDSAYLSTADVAKASRLDPKSRAAVLGESQLPGKSVFDFLSQDARDRIAAATGRKDLPEARGEVPAAYALTEEEKRDQLLNAVPSLDKATAVAAITRGARGGGPYQDNETKRSRYRAYLEFQAGITTSLPPKPMGVKDDDWLREAHEFYNCARIFKPMSGPMASRFTTSTASSTNPSSAASGTAGNEDRPANLVTRPAPKQQDPAEEAAKMGMYGQMTRTVGEFFPTRLLCKRMGVKPPDIVQPDADAGMGRGYGTGSSSWSSAGPSYGGGSSSYSAAPQSPTTKTAGPTSTEASAPEKVPPSAPAQAPVIQPDRNEALEGKRASEDVFRAVFGDSDDDDE
ncbi:hypothetical protein SBRCBS47491_007849 [Sporothrix bragantina]|uniref:G-patch domain-containing protein n=1 Tax=Sporothrix bragantina TaxID=671064 RepID=A0ABP0CIH7_9PEZI